jgi:hypothetical protein
MNEGKADRVEDGMTINLDHENYFTRIVPAYLLAEQKAEYERQSSPGGEEIL